MPRLHAFAPTALLLTLLTGCAATPPPLPPELVYQPPRGNPATLATIVGSQEDSGWADDFTAWVTAVDGRQVESGREGWNQPLALPAGAHRLAVSFRRGGYRAQSDLDLNAAAGRTYALRFRTDVGFNGSNTFCDFWVADKATDKPVTGVSRGAVQAPGAGPGMVFVPVVPR